MGILNMYAVVACPEEKEDEYLTSNSLDFHRHLGFEKAGLYHRCGYKFGRWYNVACMEKIIGTHSGGQRPVTPFPGWENIRGYNTMNDEYFMKKPLSWPARLWPTAMSPLARYW